MVVASFQAKIGCKSLKKIEKKKLSFRFVLAWRVIENFKKKFKKTQKNTIMASFQTKIGWKWMRNRENKNSNSISFLHDA